MRHLLAKKREVIEATGADVGFVYGNADEGGFFRPEHGERELRDLIQKKASDATVTYEELDAPYGHDTFLIEHRRLGAMIERHLSAASV